LSRVPWAADEPRPPPLLVVARVVLGFPMYGSEEFVDDVLDSLLAQDFEDLAIVALDDCSPDRTLEIAQKHAARDPRLIVEANPSRLGMIGNWNRALERAYELFPEFEFFAWASDNDLREPAWVSTLVREHEENPGAVLAYSRFGTFKDGEKLAPARAKWLFETRGIASRHKRFVATMDGMRAGPIMYGLHRRGSLDQAGNVPQALLSDFIFLSYLSLYGPFLQAPEVLWYRDLRRTTGSSTRKQRAALFAGDPPAMTYLPVWLQHSAWLIRTMVIVERRPADLSRGGALLFSLAYTANWWTRLTARGPGLIRKRYVRPVRRRLAPYKRRGMRRLAAYKHRSRRVLRVLAGRDEPKP
jgi:glycosyltransferase involved in cell wall biosynthesis